MRFTWQPAGVGGGTRRLRRRLLRGPGLAAVTRLPPRTTNRCGRKRAHRRKERCCRRRERLTSINACECSRSAEVSARSSARSFVRSSRIVRESPLTSSFESPRITITVLVFVAAAHSLSTRVRHCSLSDQPAPTPPSPSAPPSPWETCERASAGQNWSST